MTISAQRVKRMLREEFPDAEITMGGSGHYKVKFPDGLMVSVSASPSRTHFMSSVRKNVKQMRLKLREGAR